MISRYLKCSMWFKFLKENESIPDDVKAKPTYNNYISENDNSLSTVNQLRQSLSEMIYRTHGVSLRHLQGYLNWIIFKRHMSFKVDKASEKSWKTSQSQEPGLYTTSHSRYRSNTKPTLRYLIWNHPQIFRK